MKDVDQNIATMIGIFETSAKLRDALPEVRRLALVETLRASGGWERGRGMLLENLETSPYIPREEKGRIAAMALSESWDELRSALRCQQTDAPQGDEYVNDECECDDDELRERGSHHARHPQNTELRSFRFMVVSIFSRSKKMQTISAERRQRIGAAIHRATCKEELLELALSSLESSEGFDFETRGRVANDILDQRYDLLLLPDRFDCEDLPRLTLDVASSPSDCQCHESGEGSNKKDVGVPCDDSEICPVCLGAHLVEVTTPCGHGFCRDCISHWSITDFVCPICRASILKEPPRKSSAAADNRSVSLDGNRPRSSDSGSSWYPARHCERPLHSQSFTALDGSTNGHLMQDHSVPLHLSQQLTSRNSANAGDDKFYGRYDKLTVFQAAPLAYSCDGVLRPIEMLDFDREREMLQESFKDAADVGSCIDVVFETATTDRLAAFLAMGDDMQVLHFSCHGNPNYLCFEDGWGGAHFLKADELRDFVSAGDGGLRFVFVSACFSRAVGEAFVTAGARHVLCCQQEEPLMDVATAVFTSSFYRALACGKSLKTSVELGRQALRLSPLVPDSESEMDKFLLLPEDVDHNIPIFYTKAVHRLDRPQLQTASLESTLPHPPQRFVGREIDCYKTLQALRRGRLVKVRGESGLGKRSLVSTVCHYIQQRRRSFQIGEIFWFPPVHMGRLHCLSSPLHALIDLMKQDMSGDSLDEYYRVCGTIIYYLSEKKAILVVDVKNVAKESAAAFIRDLLTGTKYVKIILIDHYDTDIQLSDGGVESEITIGPLGLYDSVVLFGLLCPYVLERRCPRIRSPRQLSNLLVPKDQGMPNSMLSKRCMDVYKLIGEGVPAKIHAAAKDMSAYEYDRLIEIGQRKEREITCQTRAELDFQLKDLEVELHKAVRSRDFLKAAEIQDSCGELERLQELLPELDELKKMLKATRRDLDLAVSSKDFGVATKLNAELIRLEDRIRKEETTSSRMLETHGGYSPNSAESDGKCEYLQFATRSELEAEMRRLDYELGNAVAERDFALAKVIQRSLSEMKKLSESMPSLSQLTVQFDVKNAELAKAVQNHEFGVAEGLSREVKELEKKMRLESESEKRVLSSDNQFLLAARRKGCILKATHETYIRAIFCELKEAGDGSEEGLRSGRQQAFRVVECLDKDKYHMTWTYFWIQMVTMAREKKRMAHTVDENPDTFQNFIHSSQNRFLLNPNYIFEYYSEAVLRRGAQSMLLPDKKSLPSRL